MTHAPPPRIPEELLTSNLPFPAFRLWLAIRKRQGENATAWHPVTTYAREARVHVKKVYRYLDALVESGWIERGEGKHLSCRIGRAHEPSKRGKAGGKAAARKSCSTTLQGVEQTTTLQGVGVLPVGCTTTTQQGGHTNPERIQTESGHPPSPPVGGGEGRAQGSGSRSPADLEPGPDLPPAVVAPPVVAPPPELVTPEVIERDSFEGFWQAYPKKRSKGAARKAWAKTVARDPALAETILEDVLWRRERDPKWTKDGGRYIPYPATYLNSESWTDERPDPNTGLTAVERRARAFNNPREAYARLRRALATPPDAQPAVVHAC